MSDSRVNRNRHPHRPEWSTEMSYNNTPTGYYGIEAIDPATPGALICGSCGRAWAEDITPAGRCPWEIEHRGGDDDE